MLAIKEGTACEDKRGEHEEKRETEKGESVSWGTERAPRR